MNIHPITWQFHVDRPRKLGDLAMKKRKEKKNRKEKRRKEKKRNISSII